MKYININYFLLELNKIDKINKNLNFINSNVWNKNESKF